MSAHILDTALDTASIGPASRYIREAQDALLAHDAEELAALRFSIILTARWEASDSEDRKRRAELRGELAQLRRCYGDKVDEIAMTFGVQQAMKTKEEVELTVIVPRDIEPMATPCDDEEREDGEVDL